jgi:3-oxoacyl-[acyl-carrier-protein] synthase II
MTGNRRVVVTGTGAISCLGIGVPALWDGLVSGRSGIGPTTRFDITDCRCKIAGEIRDFNIEAFTDDKDMRRLDRFCHYAFVAAKEAMAQSGITSENTDLDRAGCLVSSGIGGLDTLSEQAFLFKEKGLRRLSPLMVPKMIIDICPGQLSIMYKFRGPNLAVVSACASGNHSIGESWWMIKRGDADVMMAGGTEACISSLGVGGFASMRALSERVDEPQRASRPFDAQRDGFVPAEGAGVVILEELEHAKKRGATILAEVIGYGLSGDANHITAPLETGDGGARAVRMALGHAGIKPEDVGYINAHGTSTPLNDKVETRMFKSVFGEYAYKVPISSSKSMIGHMLGAAGGIEAVICIQTLLNGVIHPTINYENPDPDCDLDYVPNVARKADVKIALSTNLGFGGHNAALLLKKWEGQ